MADVNELLARLNRTTASPHQDYRRQFSHPTPTGSAAMFSPPSESSQQRPSSTTFGFGQRASPAPDREASDRTANLLNLLKFNQPAASSPAANQQASDAHKTVSAADQPLPQSPPPPTAQATNAAPPGNPQELLLNLLNRAQSSTKEPTSADIPAEAVPRDENKRPAAEERHERGTTPVRVFGSVESDRSTPFQAPQTASKGPVFTYVNPFEQLAASSPHNRLSQPETGKPNGSAAKSISPAPSPLPDGRSKIEALMGIGAGQERHERKETVSEALHEVAGQADREVKEALDVAEYREQSNGKRQRTEQLFDEEDLHRAAIQIKEDLKDSETRARLERDMPPAMAQAFEDTINEIAKEGVADSWESADAEDSPTKAEEDGPVRVYNFPMRPFVAIDILESPPASSSVRPEIVMKIASLKKDFDQIDRNLATATTNYIVYATAKGGGIRVIRQDSGSNKQAFRKAANMIFSLDISPASSSSDGSPTETVLAISSDGTVFWTKLDLDFFPEDLDSQGFIFPPLSSGDENTSGAQLKTRAKLSSRNQNFFAVGRGKSIYIIWPSLAMDPQYIDSRTRKVNSEKYLADHSVKISTGKAGKDFVFSKDDSCLVSLDKSGSLKFWDIRSLTDTTKVQSGRMPAAETKIPMMVLVTTPVEKSRATSVQFVDKERPTVKGTALRYLLVGHKQNHTLQLWDLGLERPVQELNFPQTNDTDPICSVAYHPKSAIIAVGHPTRNSIYLIHLSAPKYNLPSLSQARYIERLAAKDGSLPKPESTAIMSGIREISLDPLGQLRSLDILNPSSTTVEKVDQDDETLFEIYLMHSKGVTCLNFKRRDLGWSRDGKVLHGLDASVEGLISVKDIVATAPAPESVDRASQPVHSDAPARADPFITQSEQTQGTSAARLDERSVPATTVFGADAKTRDSKSDRKNMGNSSAQGPVIMASYASAAQRSLAAAPSSSTAAKELPPPVSTDPPRASVPLTVMDSAEQIPSQPRFEGNNSSSAEISANLTKTISDQFTDLYRRLDSDKRVQEAAGAAKQDAILRLVSSSLTENVEKSLSRIVISSIRDSVVPSISDVTASTLDRKFSSEAMSQQLRHVISHEVRSSLLPAVESALQSPEVLRSVTDLVADSIAHQVENVVSSTLNNSIASAFDQLAADAVQRIASEVDRRVSAQLHHAQIQHQNDGAKLDHLANLATELLDTVRTMAGAQSALQDELLKLQAQLTNQRELSLGPSGPLQSPPSAPKDPEADSVMASLSSGKLEEGIIKWLQSARQVELFDKVLVNFSSTLLLELNQIVALSATAALTVSFETNVAQRLEWLEVALASLDSAPPDVAEVAPRIMDVLTQRLQELYMQLAETNPSDPLLGQIHRLVRRTKELKARAG